MFIVTTYQDGEDNVPHSAWSTLKEAERQQEVLVKYGYKSTKIREDNTVTTDSGHYYV